MTQEPDRWTPHLAPAEIIDGSRLDGVALRRFHAWQAQGWPRLGQALTELDGIETRELPMGDRPVQLQWNPGRVTSTTARVDKRGVEARPCFLCPDSLPPEEQGVAFGRDLVFLANPAPIVPLHLVIAHRDHRPQAIDGALQLAIEAARAAEGVLTVFYNGPRCGASAPDHLHLQAVESGSCPDERIVTCRLAGCGREPVGRELVKRSGLQVWSNRGSARTLVVMRGLAESVERGLRLAIDGLALLNEGAQEPPLNLLLSAEGLLVTALLYPRGAHRPACYFAEGEQRCLVSPGALDMAGLVITVRRRDYERIDPQMMERIYQETSIDGARADQLERLLEQRLNNAG